MNCTVLHTVDPAINREYPVPRVTEQTSKEANSHNNWWGDIWWGNLKDSLPQRETETTQGRRRVLDWGLERLLWGGDISVNPKGKGEANEFRIWRKGILGERNNMCKGPEVGTMWVEGGVSENMGSPRGKRQGGRGKWGRVCFFQVRSFWGI